MHSDVVTAAGFILDDPAVQADPYDFYPLLRAQHPILRTDFFGHPCWVLSRRGDISAVLMDPKTFSSRTTPIDLLLFTDPPDHARLRRMVADRFTRAAVDRQLDRIASVAEERWSAFLDAGGGDAIDDFASPLTITMMSALLGISVDEVDDVRGLSLLLAEFANARRVGATPRPAVASASERIAALILGIVERRSYQSDGAIAALAARFDAGELSADQLVQFATLLFVAGHSTTTNLIGNACYMLAQHPAELERLHTEPAYAERFVEEVLRTRPSFHRILRVTTREVTLHGVTIPAGGIVRLLLASANRDEATRAEGERFDPDVAGRAHLSFGQGIHTCLGVWLARLESRVAMGVVGAQTATLALDPDRAPTPLTGGTFNEFGFEHLPLVAARR